MNALPEVKIVNLGLVDYKEAWDIQEQYFRRAMIVKLPAEMVKTYLFPRII